MGRRKKTDDRDVAVEVAAMDAADEEDALDEAMDAAPPVDDEAGGLDDDEIVMEPAAAPPAEEVRTVEAPRTAPPPPPRPSRTPGHRNKQGIYCVPVIRWEARVLGGSAPKPTAEALEAARALAAGLPLVGVPDPETERPAFERWFNEQVDEIVPWMTPKTRREMDDSMQIVTILPKK